MAEIEPIPYRIRVGVTGHRRPDDAAVETAVREALDAGIVGLFPPEARETLARVRAARTTPIAYRVLSPLAEGADRVVAKAVLSMPGARLDAVLPLTIEDYLEDFETEESKQEFLSLLALSRRPTLLRTRNIRDERHDQQDRAEMRRRAYNVVGQYIVDHCDVLIAVWDGEPARGRGGTAEAVAYALEQNRPVIRVWQGAYELLNRGTSNGLNASALEGIDRFNRLPITAELRDAYSANLDKDFFEKPQSAAGIPASTREVVNRCLFPWYAQASIEAKGNQKRFHTAGKYVYTLSAAAVGCAAVGVLFRPLAALGFGLELILLLVMIRTLRRARRTHAHQAWIENRFLTERIRAGTFMAICGVEPRPIEVLPYMGHSQSSNDWTVRVFDEIWDRLPPLPGCDARHCLLMNSYVRETWLGDQIAFHTDKEQREGRARKGLAVAGAVVLPTTVAAAALHLLLLLWEPGSASPEPVRLLHHGLHQGLAFIALLFPAIAASLAGMEAHREHLRLEKRSANMGPQLERLNKQMASASDSSRFEELLRQLDELILRETQDWLMLMRYVEIKAS
jgi:hypothetical protein